MAPPQYAKLVRESNASAAVKEDGVALWVRRSKALVLLLGPYPLDSAIRTKVRESSVVQWLCVRNRIRHGTSNQNCAVCTPDE